jgi:molybdopterin synthase catalytic subunit
MNRMSADQPLIDIQLLDGPVQPVAFSPFPQPAGAECVFLGRTRRETHPQFGELRRLCYEAYRPMALKVLDELAHAAQRQFKCLAVRIHHAIGEVPPGQASVLVQVVCGHRGSAFEACRFLIDRLKSHAPIWKREQWADGSTWSGGTAVAPAEGACAAG